MIPNMPNKPRRFRGVTLPPGYEKILNEAVEQDMRDPEDAGSPEIPNQLKKYGGLNPTD